MSDQPQQQDRTEADRQLLVNAQQKGRLATLFAFLRLSGPGWLQSAITLGGGSLASSLYLGVVAGVALLWVQPFAMVLGIIMLSGIAYVTLSTGERPFRAINRHVNPVLGWSWALAALAANMFWCLPQYSLADGVLQQNLLPGVLGPDGSVVLYATGIFGEGSWLAANAGKLVIAVSILVVTTLITWSYDSGRWGIKLYEWILKLMVAGIVLSFIGVIWSLGSKLNWGSIAWGFIPDFRKLFEPSDSFQRVIESSGYAAEWARIIVHEQREMMISAAATAVGINMTFLFPYSLLAKRWTREFRGLSVFDLATGMFIPFVLATSCVVMAAASQFHTQPVAGFLGEVDSSGTPIVPDAKARAEYYARLRPILQTKLGKESLAETISATDPRGWLLHLVSAETLREELGETAANQLQATDKSLADAVKELSKSELAAFTKLLGAKELAVVENAANELSGVLAAMDPETRKRMRSGAIDALRAELGRIAIEQRIDALPVSDRRIAAMLIHRSAFDLAKALSPFTGDRVANVVFGLGVLGMTLSTITLLMLISGFVVCEIFNLPQGGWPHRFGCLAAATGVLGPFIWGQASFYLAVYVSVFGMMLLPIAYWSFFFLFNRPKLLGADMPRGGRRIAWNSLMVIAATVATFASIYSVWDKTKWNGIIAMGGLLGLALVVQVYRWLRPAKPADDAEPET